MCPSRVGTSTGCLHYGACSHILAIFYYAVDLLFSCLLKDGFEKRLQVKEYNWKYVLPKQYHTFSGDYPGFRGKHGDSAFRFYVSPALDVQLQLAPPLVTKSVSGCMLLHSSPVALCC